jgi:hypothetical protein
MVCSANRSLGNGSNRVPDSLTGCVKSARAMSASLVLRPKYLNMGVGLVLGGDGDVRVIKALV